jgi:hypothetical protein
MTHPTAGPDYVEITKTLVRLYVFLVQHLDRCLQETGQQQSFPEHELTTHLADTQAKMMETLSVNPVVKAKVEKECERVLSLSAACLRGGAERTSAINDLKAERAVLQNKTAALSDLLAVFRAT